MAAIETVQTNNCAVDLILSIKGLATPAQCQSVNSSITLHICMATGDLQQRNDL
jgi:hypothetical protein